MSFSKEIKEELLKVVKDSKSIVLAELIAIISLVGKIKVSVNDEYKLYISTESAGLARKYFTILKKTFNISTDIIINKNNIITRVRSYIISVRNDEDVRNILRQVGILDRYNNICDDLISSDKLLKSISSKKAFLRTSFIVCGSMSDPEKAYHLEFVCKSLKKAEQLKNLILYFDLDAKIVERKNKFVVYLKEGEQISSFLALMEARKAVISLENIRILKDVRNNINRKVNCETANINKTVFAAIKQIEDIEFIKDKYGLDILPKSLKEIALVRLQYPEASLLELSSKLDGEIGKSGINHRLRKISEIALSLGRKG